MKDLYTKTLTQLQTVTGLNWIDLDKGQLNVLANDGDRPPVAFPCALLGFQIAPATDRNEARTRQQVQVIVTVRLAFDFTGNTSDAESAEDLAASLDYWDIVDGAWAALQGWKPEGYSGKFTRTSMREEQRPDKIKVVAVTYSITYEETVP